MWIKTLGENEIINTNCIEVIFIKDNYIKGVIYNIGTFDLFKCDNKQEAEEGLKKLLKDLNNKKDLNYKVSKYSDASVIHVDKLENCNFDYYLKENLECNLECNSLVEANRKWIHLKEYVKECINDCHDDNKLSYQKILNKINKIDSIFGEIITLKKK